MQDDDGLIHDGDKEEHETSMDVDWGAASAYGNAEPRARERRSGQPSSTKHKRPIHGALPVGHANSDTITDHHEAYLRRPLPKHRSALGEARAAQPSLGHIDFYTAREAGFNVKTFHNIGGEGGHPTRTAGGK